MKIPIPKKSYEWKFDVLEILDVHDADTCKLKIDMGFGIYAIQYFRLYGINAPEITGTPEYEKSDLFKLAQKAKMYLLNRLNKAMEAKQKIEVQVVKKEKFGRWLAIILINKKNVNEELLNKGFARFYMGIGSKDLVWKNYKGV